MLNINPINHNTNINFKSQRDYSRLYKEMEKISLTREEKIKPKVKFSDIISNIKSNYHDKMRDARYKMADALDEMVYYNLGDFVDRHLGSVIIGAMIIVSLCLFPGIYVLIKSALSRQEAISFHSSSKNNFLDDTNTKTDAFNQADVLENLYKQGDISLAEYKQEMQKVIDIYDVNAHMELFAEKGIYPDESIDKNALKDQYYHDEYGNLVARGKNHYDTSQNYDLTTDIDCSEVDNNINILKDKVSKIEADKTSVSSTTLVNDSIVKAKTDSLINSYQNKTISFDEFQKSIGELNKKD